MRLLPTMTNIEAAQRIYDRLEQWRLFYETISGYFQRYCENTEIQVVLIKTTIVNSLYATQMRSPWIWVVAKEMAKLPNLDEWLCKGEVAAVKAVEELECAEIERAGRSFIRRAGPSFASKYCHFHNPDAFPMFDQYVCKALATFGFARQRPYSAFYESIRAFREKAKLVSVEWKDLDKYLWLYGQKLVMGQEDEKAVNQEVSKLYKKKPDEFKKLDPNSK